MGRRPAAMPPSSTMTIEMTHARTGRSMKKRASMTVLLFCGRGSGPGCGLRKARRSVGAPGFGGRHVDQLRLHGEARPHLLQAVDDHPLARLQAVGDLAQAVMECSEANGAGDDLVLLVDDVEDLLALVGVEGTIGDQQRPVASADGHTDTGEKAWEKVFLRVGEHAPHPYGASLRVDLVVHEVDGPLVGVALLVGQPQGDGVSAVAGR